MSGTWVVTITEQYIECIQNADHGMYHTVHYIRRWSVRHARVTQIELLEVDCLVSASSWKGLWEASGISPYSSKSVKR